MTPYKLQLVQELKDTDKPARCDFCKRGWKMTNSTTNLFSATRRPFTWMAKLTSITLAYGAPRTRTHVLSISEIPLRWTLSKKAVYGPYFFQEATVKGDNYLNMLETWLMDQLRAEESNDFILQQDGAPAHWSLRARQFLSTTLPDRWIGWSGRNDRAFMPWPPTSPDLTPCDFFVWGFVKQLVYVPPLPNDVDELKTQITDAVGTTNNALLERVWQEFDYHFDVCRVTNGAHIEHIWTVNRKLKTASFRNM